jgi:hypothetical protein
MLSTQVQLLINCISSLSESEKMDLFKELEKIEKPVSKTVPKKNKFDIDAMAQQLLIKHRKKYNTASKLA